MKTLSEYIKPQEILKLDLVRVQLWENQDDSIIEYYELPDKTVNYLKEFISDGKMSPEIALDLRSALDELPEWQKLSIDELSKEQRECTAAVYIRSIGRRFDFSFQMQLNANIF